MLDLPYLAKTKAKGQAYYYYRRNGKRIALPNIDHKDFRAAYDKIHKRLGAKEPDVDPRSFSAMVNAYKASGEYLEKADRTRADYGRILDVLKEQWGDLTPADITRAGVMLHKDSLAKTPRTANYHMAVIRLVLNYGVDRGWLTSNPALRPNMLKTGEGRKTWPAQAIAIFREKNADNAEMLLALDLGLYTGQRLGDVIKMRADDYDGQTIQVVQNKTAEKLVVPVHPALKKTLDELPRRFMILLTKTGRAFKPTHLGHEFRKAVIKAGLDGFSFHGLRTTAATCLAEAGCSDAEIASITGHRTQSQVAHYRRGAARSKMAVVAMGRWERNQADLPNRDGSGPKK